MPLKNKYLKYTPEITLEIFTLVYNKLIECKFQPTHELNYAWRQFSGKYPYFWCYKNNEPNQFEIMNDNRFKETTVEEILGYNPFIKDDFVLPKNWCVKLTKDNNLLVMKYCKLNFNWHDKIEYATSNGTHFNGEDLRGYTEITFDQFKTYVLKEPIEQPKEVIPEYVECISNFSHFTKGRIYNWPEPVNDDGYTRTDLISIEIWRERFKPSTKEAYDAQNQPKSIEKWSVGSYVVFCKYGDHRKPIGFIDKIIGSIQSNVCIVCELYSSLSTGRETKGEIKWFATLQEAEEFAKTLVKPVKESIELSKFPNEGCCKTDRIELRNYLQNKFPNVFSSWNSKKHTIVGWNSNGYWFCQKKSGYDQYQFESLEGFLNPKSIFADIKGLTELKDKLQKETKFEVGKWYKSPEWSGFWIKCSNFNGHEVSVNEIINKGEYRVKSDKYTYLLNTYIQLTDLSEIQQYLPDNHPDKISELPIVTSILNNIKQQESDIINSMIISKHLLYEGEGIICRQSFGLFTTNPCKEILWERKSNLLLSINDEELPMVNIIKTNIVNLLNND